MRKKERVAMGDGVGEPDVTLGWGSETVWDGEGDGVKAVWRWSGMEESVAGEVVMRVVS